MTLQVTTEEPQPYPWIVIAPDGRAHYVGSEIDADDLHRRMGDGARIVRVDDDLPDGMTVDLPDGMTASGVPIWFLHPERTEIRPHDIRTALARICRYGGHWNYSVLQHLALCVELAKRRALGWGLFSTSRATLITAMAVHDMHEAYVGDVPTFLKRAIGKAYTDIEDRWEDHVHKSIGIEIPTPELKPLVKLLDRHARAIEMAVVRHPFAAYCATHYVERPLTNGEIELGSHAQQLDATGAWGIVADPRILPSEWIESTRYTDPLRTAERT